jgi:hypothetical protein
MRRKPSRITDAPLAFLTAGCIASALVASAQEVQHLTVTQPGGMPGMPLVTGIERTSNGVTVTWDGPSGYYRLFQKLGLTDGDWQQVRGPSLDRRAAITDLYSNAFFRVSGPPPQYAGSQACLECHESIHNSERETRHAHALEALKSKGQQNNPSCLPCHTVGYGLPSGFVSEAVTPHLAGVQCENCHGPAANHAAVDSDLIVRPRVELAAQVCGGCHNETSHRPHFEEWSASAHVSVTEDMNPAGRISSCGRCHSGSSRISLLKNDPLPEGDANVGITCVVCHDPHRPTAHAAQLRNPVTSTNDYFLATSDAFANKYDPAVNICAQCHNHRGASWTSSSRPPHHSPQYNVLLGTIGELSAGPSTGAPAAHAFLEKQCVTCHMQTQAPPDESHPGVAGHKFKVETFDTCLACHPLPELLVDFTASVISTRIQQVKSELDLWGTTKAPEPLRTKYGARAWEYTNAGELSGPGPAPTAAEQGQVPDAIKKARFNLYLVLYDGSHGVHNGPYTINLLEAARSWVQQELNK